MGFSIIACVGENLELGRDNDLVFHFKKDMEFFREMTLGHAVVMGRKTFESLPGVLKGRKNYVITSHPESLPEEVIAVADLEEFKRRFLDKEEETFVIGGAKIYAQFLDSAEKIYLTEVASEAEADVYFPSFNKEEYDKIVIGEGEEKGVKFKFCKYIKRR